MLLQRILLSVFFNVGTSVENLGVERLNAKRSRVHERPLANKSSNNIRFLRQFNETFFNLLKRI